MKETEERNISIGQLYGLMESMSREISELRNEVADMRKVQDLQSKPVLNRQEAARFLGVSMAQMQKLSSKRILTWHKTEGKMSYYKKDDLLDFMMGVEIDSDLEVQEKACKRLRDMKERRTEPKRTKA